MVHIVDICGIQFSQSLLGIYVYGDNGGYWGLGSIVSSGENVQGNWVASINVAGIFFKMSVRGRTTGVAVDIGEWSCCHPRICDTKASFGHSGV